MASLAEGAGTNDRPRLFVSPGCPYALKIMIFLNDAGIRGTVQIADDTSESRKYVKDKCDGKASFPALELSGRILQLEDVDSMVDFFVEKHNIDVASLYTFNDYCTGVFPRYRMMLGRVIREVGGWPKAFPAIGVKKILVLGASGMVGSRVVHEAKLRGHQVTSASRKNGVRVDANDVGGLEKVLSAHDALLVSMGPSRKNDGSPRLVLTYHAIIEACKRTGTRVVFVGGAGSSEASEGVLVVDTPGFPDFIKDEAMQHVEALKFLQTLDDTVTWTTVSPPAQISPGKRTGKYRAGVDNLISTDGVSKISAEDFAIAMLDALDKGLSINQRMTVGY
jgi:uncharacterized protein